MKINPNIYELFRVSNTLLNVTQVHARLHWLESTSHVSCRPKKLFVLIEVRLPSCIKLFFVFLGLPWEQSFLLQNTFVTLRFNNYLILLHCLKCASHDQTPCRSKT